MSKNFKTVTAKQSIKGGVLLSRGPNMPVKLVLDGEDAGGGRGPKGRCLRSSCAWPLPQDLDSHHPVINTTAPSTCSNQAVGSQVPLCCH